MNDRTVIWSGGYDSTLVLWEELLKNKEARAVSFVLPGLSTNKILSEQMARERFKKKVVEKGWKLSHSVVTLSYDWQDFRIGGGYPQQTLWLMLGVWFANDKDTLLYGYIKRDDYWMEENKFTSLAGWIKSTMEKEVTLEFPLRSIHKHEVYRKILGYGLEDCVFSCEDPKVVSEPCGKCEPCIKLAVTKKEIEIRGLDTKEVADKDEAKDGGEDEECQKKSP